MHICILCILIKCTVFVTQAMWRTHIWPIFGRGGASPIFGQMPVVGGCPEVAGANPKSSTPTHNYF